MFTAFGTRRRRSVGKHILLSTSLPSASWTPPLSTTGQDASAAIHGRHGLITVVSASSAVNRMIG